MLDESLNQFQFVGTRFQQASNIFPHDPNNVGRPVQTDPTHPTFCWIKYVGARRVGGEGVGRGKGKGCVPEESINIPPLYTCHSNQMDHPVAKIS